MKRIIIAMAMAVLTSSSAMAQDDKGHKPPQKLSKTEMAQKRTDRMVSQYGLSKKQATKLLALNTKYADKMGPGHGPGGPRPAGGKRPGGKPDGSKPQGKPDSPAPEGKPDGQRPPREPDTNMKKRMEEHKAAQKAYDAELQKIMSADQFKKYQADEAKRRNHPPRRGGEGKPQPKDK